MNVLASECSSGCESGWTLYLDQSFLSENASSHSHRGDEEFNRKKYRGKNEQEEEEEDLSMISDASSGPPHFNEEVYSNDNNGFLSHAPKGMSKTSGKRKKKCKADRNLLDQQHHSTFLDDTASSPVFNYSSQNNYSFTNRRTSMESVLDFSQDISATHHFEGRSAFQGNYGFANPSPSGNQPENNQWLTRGWE